MSPVNEVVADTTPLNYLILIRQAEILASLFHQVLIPEAVLIELRHPKAPEAVSQWLKSSASRLETDDIQSGYRTIGTIRGEDLSPARRISDQGSLNLPGTPRPNRT